LCFCLIGCFCLFFNNLKTLKNLSFCCLGLFPVSQCAGLSLKIKDVQWVSGNVKNHTI
jgi:hypothetical protein